jgi:hypothetical protein
LQLKTVLPMPDPEHGFQFYYDAETGNLRPHLVFVDRDGAVVFETNEAGLKGDGFDERRKLAVVWGDSVVFGAGRGWPCFLDRFAPGYQFLNGGIEGDAYANILKRAQALNRRRAVALNLVMLGWHPFPDNRGVARALTAFLEGTPNTVMLTMPTAINRHIADSDLSAWLTDRDAADAFTFCGNIPYSVALQRQGFDYILERNAIVREVCARTGTPCADLFAILDTEPLDDFRRDFHDVLHPRASAYPMIAQAVYDRIKHLLQPTEGGPDGSRQ